MFHGKSSHVRIWHKVASGTYRYEQFPQNARMTGTRIRYPRGIRGKPVFYV